MNQLIAINEFQKKINQFACIDSFEVKENASYGYYISMVINLNRLHENVLSKELDKLFELLKSLNIKYEYSVIKKPG
ncbi:MAG: hypothetical protein O9302_00250 [Cyclobacteriaceae bacterium]|jgi:hypothetical protein|nr:hypothetical protein [Cytophagales bacterium]MCZ8326461.1 hypothetical protein [Cyclobacteriaceae bacterium]